MSTTFQHRISDRSRHCGLAFSISSIFQALFHSLIAFSRAIADCIVPCSSYQTSVNSVALRETVGEVVLVLPHPLPEVGSQAQVQRSVALAGENVDAGLLHEVDSGFHRNEEVVEFEFG